MNMSNIWKHGQRRNETKNTRERERERERSVVVVAVVAVATCRDESRVSQVTELGF